MLLFENDDRLVPLDQHGAARRRPHRMLAADRVEHDAAGGIVAVLVALDALKHDDCFEAWVAMTRNERAGIIAQDGDAWLVTRGAMQMVDRDTRAERLERQ